MKKILAIMLLFAIAAPVARAGDALDFSNVTFCLLTDRELYCDGTKMANNWKDGFSGGFLRAEDIFRSDMGAQLTKAGLIFSGCADYHCLGTSFVRPTKD